MVRLIKIVILGALLVLGMGQYTRWANRDLIELTEARRAALLKIQPVLLRYKTDTGQFPASLDMLVPRYLPEIPQVLRNGGAEAIKQIRYERTEGTVRVSYHVIRGPDSTEVFDVASGTFAQDR